MKAFISHSSIDKEFVTQLATDLQNRGKIDIWLDEWSINLGEIIPEKIEKGILESDVFILILSPDSVHSRWVEYEMQAWLTLQVKEEKNSKENSIVSHRRMIPILYKECEKPVFIQSMKYIEINDQNYEDKLNQLINSINGNSKKLLTAEDSNLRNIPEKILSRKKCVLTLLKSLLPSQFDEVVFLYGISRSYLSNSAPQAIRAIELVQYAELKEGEMLQLLVDSICEVEPFLKGRC